MSKQHRLLDRVRDEDHRSRPLLPDAQQFELKNFASLRVHGREGLVHQQDIRLNGQRAR